jgi:hypothetical protein
MIEVSCGLSLWIVVFNFIVKACHFATGCQLVFAISCKYIFMPKRKEKAYGTEIVLSLKAHQEDVPR